MAGGLVRVAVGTLNPAKLDAARRAVHAFWPLAIVKGVDVPSFVAHTPSGRALERGAQTRARQALETEKTDFGLGLEGGLHTVEGVTYITGYVSATNGVETHGAYTLAVECPPDVLAEIKRGKELGAVMDELTGESNTRQAGGAIGFLTGGKVSRADAFFQAACAALAPFAKKEKPD